MKALCVFRQLPRTGELVFSRDGKTSFQGHSKAKKRLDQLSGVSGWTLHDLRRTAVSGMARLGIAPHIARQDLKSPEWDHFGRGCGLPNGTSLWTNGKRRFAYGDSTSQ